MKFLITLLCFVVFTAFGVQGMPIEAVVFDGETVETYPFKTVQYECVTLVMAEEMKLEPIYVDYRQPVLNAKSNYVNFCLAREPTTIKNLIVVTPKKSYNGIVTIRWH